METERTKNAFLNTFFGLINKIITLVCPFVVRTVFIKTLGMEYLGLNSLFGSIMNVLSIAELGVGSAIVFSMYSAIAKQDNETMCALMNLYKKAYRVIGSIILTVGLVITPLVPFLVKGTTPKAVSIYVVYVIHLLSTVLGYFMFAYRSCLLTAFQKSYVISNVASLSSFVVYVLQILFLIKGRGYYWYISVMLVGAVLCNVTNAILSKRMFPEYNPSGKVSNEKYKDIVEKIKALLFYRIGGVVLISVDSIVISAFLGLTALAKYNNYYYIIQTLFGFLAVYYGSITAGIGNSIASESREKNYNDFRKLTFIQKWIIAWFSACLLCLYQPFMKLWVGAENMLPFGIVISLTAYFYLWKMMEIINVYKDASGMWQYDKYRPLVASVFNLLLNLIFVNVIGLYGIVLSTVAAIFIVIMPWSTHTVFKHYFNNGFKEYMFRYFADMIIAAVICVATYFITNLITGAGITAFIIKCVVCAIFPNILLMAIFFSTKDFKETRPWITEKIKLIIGKKA